MTAMCAKYIPSRDGAWLAQRFGLELPPPSWQLEAYPGRSGPIVTLSAQGSARLSIARFGLVPAWALAGKGATQMKAYSLFNARVEEVTAKRSYRPSWISRRYGLVLVDAFFEECHESGRAVRHKIGLVDREPLAIACVWNEHQDRESGEIHTSFSMLTINGENHAIARRMHRPGDEKRMPCIVRDEQLHKWLDATPENAIDFLAPYPAELMYAEPAPVVRLPKLGKQLLISG